MDEKTKIKELIGNNRVGMFVTQSNNKIFSRPIAYADVDDDNCIWFFTDINSEKINDIIQNSEVNFSFANQSDNEYVSLSGTAELVRDSDTIDDKWSFFMRAWFPEGKDADRLTLIKVVPETVQYWDGENSKILLLYNMAKSLVTGKSYGEVSDSENKIISL